MGWGGEAIMNNDFEELFKELELIINDNKQQHDMAVTLGSLGVSPKYMKMYMDSTKRIKELEKKKVENMVE